MLYNYFGYGIGYFMIFYKEEYNKIKVAAQSTA